jgi:hypothetical protein
MWKYQKTEDMFIRNSNSEIYHSDVYLGQDFSDGIKHWKYIKRERRNGRWVYYYKDDKYDKLLKESSNAYANKKIAVNNYYDAKKRYDSLNGPTSMNTYQQALNNKINAAEKANKASRKSEMADERYDEYAKKTAIRRISGKKLVKILNTSSKIIAKGKNTSSKIIAKGKKILSSLFK